jgi:hypothetical protein
MSETKNLLGRWSRTLPHDGLACNLPGQPRTIWTVPQHDQLAGLFL